MPKFKPGQSGNPDGRPRVEQELRKLRQLNLQEFSEWTQKLWRASVEELELILEDKTHSVFVHMIAKIFLEIQAGGNAKDLACLLPFIVGKPKENIQHEFPDPTIIHIPGGGRLELGVKKGESDGNPTDSET